MVVYTRTGDHGETGLLEGLRLNKGDPVFDVLGMVDELNSNIGLVVAMMENVLRSQKSKVKGQNRGVSDGFMEWNTIEMGLASLIGQLLDVQNGLFEMGSVLVKGVKKLEGKGSETDETHRLAEEFVRGKLQNEEYQNRQQIAKFDVVRFERLIDEMEEDLPKLTNFILPGGGVMGAQLMVTRAVCRKLERVLVRYLKQKMDEERQLLSYVNRLSDYFFVMSRWVNWLMGEDEKVWR